MTIWAELLSHHTDNSKEKDREREERKIEREVEREKERERESYSFIQISYNKIITTIIKTTIIKIAQKDSQREERERRVTYQSIPRHKLLLNNARVEAFFYTICPGGHQRSQLFPICAKT